MTNRRLGKLVGVIFSLGLLIVCFQNCSDAGAFRSNEVASVTGGDQTESSETLPAPNPNPAPSPVPMPQPTPSIEYGVGWTELPNSALLNVVPPNANMDLRAGTGPSAIVTAWGGGIADLKKNRLILWGGGHNDYYGNELYALEVGTGKMARITEPSPVDTLWSDPEKCPELYSDGKPVSRHTYGGMTYLPATDSMFAFSGSKATCGYASNYTWTFSFPDLSWKLRTSSGGVKPPGGYGIVADYDPNSRLVFVTALSDGGFYSYNPSTHAYVKIHTNAGMDYHMSGVIDPSRKIMVLFGPDVLSYGSQYGGVKIIDLSPGGGYKMTDITSQTVGCESLITGSPGLAFDSSQNLIVGWPNKGSTVYVFNPDTKTCTAKTFTNGPAETDKGSEFGTFGRFRYFPGLDAFALVYNAGKNAFLLKLK